MKFKKGDVVIYKGFLKSIDDIPQKSLVLTLDKKYIIGDILELYISPRGCSSWFLIKDQGFGYHIFTTLKEERKEKLEKLNEKD